MFLSSNSMSTAFWVIINFLLFSRERKTMNGIIEVKIFQGLYCLTHFGKLIKSLIHRNKGAQIQELTYNYSCGYKNKIKHDLNETVSTTVKNLKNIFF